MKRGQSAGHLRKIPALEQARRWLRYRLIIPVFRSPHSAAHTARGVANGVFWGLTPTIGLQTVEIVATWLIARRVFRRDSSLVQALIWVWVNNPLTVVPMYYVFYATGLWLSGRAIPASGYAGFSALFDETEASWLARMWAILKFAGFPMLVGCIPYAAAGGAISYRWALLVVERRRDRLRRRREYETFRTSDSSG